MLVLKTSSKIISSAVISIIYLLVFLIVYSLFPLFPFPQKMINVLIADILATIIVFIFSYLFNNSSIYDPYWSVVPPVIVIYLIHLFPEGNQTRQLVILFLVLFWSIRLTVNWLRGWQSLGHKDWRYTSIEEMTGRWYWPVSFVGIHLIPTIVVFLGCLPLWYSISGQASFNLYDWLAALFTFSAILTEWIADEQLLKFRKNNIQSAFISSGIWSYSRHPNYLGEICFWGGLFLFVISSSSLTSLTGYWTVIGFIAMVLLFKFISIPMMEKRNKTSKPGYNKYINQVPALLPRLYNVKK